MKISNFKFQISNLQSQQGQVILILLLTMLVALSIGLVVTQRSITDLATSNQTEQSTRAFSAAEAGIEQIIQEGRYGSSLDVTGLGGASAQVDASRLPAGNEALEYPPIGKEIVAQVWLADPETPGPTAHYRGPAIEVYFGNKGMSDKGLKDVDQFNVTTPPTATTPQENYIEYRPAVSLTFVNRIRIGSAYEYKSYKVYLDSYRGDRRNRNNFLNASTGVNCSTSGHSITTTSGVSRFYCMRQVDILKADDDRTPCSNNCEPMLVRIRILYATEPQKVAINPVNCGSITPCLPFQASRYISTGKVGQSQKTIEVFRVKKVVPPWFDFAIFSAGEIKK